MGNIVLTAMWTPIPVSSDDAGYGGSTSGDDDGYAVSVPAGSSIRGRAITVSLRSAGKGDIVTITTKPDDGYELSILTVTDSRGREVKLTAEGKNQYAFVMPASRVSIDTPFRKTGAGLPFTDVRERAYYCDAVLWTVENGVSNGTTDTTFSPDAP